MKLNVVLALLGHAAAVKIAREMQGADAYENVGESQPINSLASHAQKFQQPVFEQAQQEAPVYQYHEAELGAAQKKLQAYMQGKKFDAPAHFLKRGKKAKTDPISPEDMDPWVYEYSKDNTSSTLQWHAQKDSKDIAEPNMDEEVHGLASNSGAVDLLPAVRPQAEWKKKQKNSLHQTGSHGPKTRAEREALEKYIADMEKSRHEKNLATFNDWLNEPEGVPAGFVKKQQGGHTLHQIWGPSNLGQGQQQEQGEPESKKQPTGEPWALATAKKHHGHHKHHHQKPEMVQVSDKWRVGGTDPSDRNVDSTDAAKAATGAQQASNAAAAADYKRRLNPFDGLVHNDDGTIVDPTTGQQVQEQSGFVRRVY